MRIGHYAPSLWGEGGLSIYVRRLLRAQAEAGHDVRGLSLARAPVNEEAGLFIKVRGYDELFQRAEKLSLDVLHLHRAVSTLPAGSLPTIRTLHGHEPYCPSGSRYLQQWGQPCNRAFSRVGCLWGHLVDRCGSRRPHRIRQNFRRTRHEMQMLSQMPVHTVSQFLKEQMVRSGYEADNIHVIHSPAPKTNDEPAPIPDEDEPRFVFLGRISPQKGLDWLLRAFAQVKAKVHLDVAGDGYELDDMRCLAQKLGLSSRVTFHGWVEPNEAERLVKAARAVVFPSMWHEPAGLVTLEAAAHGRPVIASRVGGIPEYATEEHALLVEPGDVEALADDITQLASDRDQAVQRGHAGRRAVQDRFAMSDFVEKFDRLYAKVIGRGRTTRATPSGP